MHGQNHIKFTLVKSAV